MNLIASRCRGLVVAGLLLVPGSALAQNSQQLPSLLRSVDEPSTYVAGASGNVLLLGANMLLSGFTGGVLNWRHGGSFMEGLTKGAAGGAAVFAGKALVVSNGTLKPLLGRQLAAAGSSVVRNAGAGQGLLSDVSLPVGPVRVHLSSGAGRRAWLSLDVLSVAMLSGVLLTYDAKLDWDATLAAAAPVFTVADPDDRLPWNGRHVGGIMMLRDAEWSRRPLTESRTLAHERVHLLEYDQMALLWSDPIERALLEHWAPTRGLHRYLDINLNAALNAGLRMLPDRVNPVEVEASFLAESRH